MRISDWSSDVCSSDLWSPEKRMLTSSMSRLPIGKGANARPNGSEPVTSSMPIRPTPTVIAPATRSEEHTSELQSLMRISYAVFCLKKKKTYTKYTTKKQNEIRTQYHNKYEQKHAK